MLTLDGVKNKSSKNLKGLHPAVFQLTIALIERCYKRGVPIMITQGLRTIAEQDALYAQGRTRPGSIVTNAKGGTSYHNYGLGIDFALLLPNGSSVSWDMRRDGDGDKTPDWDEVAKEGRALGFEYGGDWTSFKDYSHFQLTFGLSISDLKSGKKPTQQQSVDIINKFIKGEDSMNKEVLVDIYVNGKSVGKGVLDNGVTYTPSRVVAEALGATVAWDKEKLRVDIKKV